jgi:hypothetical protein
METKFSASEMRFADAIEMVKSDFRVHLKNHFKNHESLWCYHYASSCSTMLAKFGVSSAEIEAITEEIRKEVYEKV